LRSFVAAVVHVHATWCDYRHVILPLLCCRSLARTSPPTGLLAGTFAQYSAGAPTACSTQVASRRRRQGNLAV
jgi:hypothetical protein